MSTKTIDPGQLDTSTLHRLLLSAVAPRPIALASSIDAQGNVNLSPFSFFNVFSAHPPILIFSPSRRSRDNTVKHTYENVKEVPEVVINMVNYPMVTQMSLSSTEYDRGVDEFTKAGFKAIPSESIRPPRVATSPISFECVVDSVMELGKEGGAGNLVICRVQRIHIREEYLHTNEYLDTTKLDLIARMGENWYCRTHKEALFEIPKPLRNRGIGVDQLPKHVLLSNILTGNHLGRLGNMAQLPDSETIAHLKASPKIQTILALTNKELQIKSLHQYALRAMEEHSIDRALGILCCLD